MWLLGLSQGKGGRYRWRNKRRHRNRCKREGRKESWNYDVQSWWQWGGSETLRSKRFVEGWGGCRWKSACSDRKCWLDDLGAVLLGCSQLVHRLLIASLLMGFPIRTPTFLFQDNIESLINLASSTLPVKDTERKKEVIIKRRGVIDDKEKKRKGDWKDLIFLEYYYYFALIGFCWCGVSAFWEVGVSLGDMLELRWVFMAYHKQFVSYK